MTIWQALAIKLGREPTRSEVRAEVRRILTESLIDRASQGKLPHQRKRRAYCPYRRTQVASVS